MKISINFQPGIFTGIALDLNYLVDQGKFVSLQEMLSLCENYSVMNWLSQNEVAIVGLFDDEAKIIIAEEFCALANAIDAKRKMGITNNGILLLAGFCLELIQSPPSRTRKDCVGAEEALKQMGLIK